MQRAQIKKLMDAGTEVAVRARGGQDFPTYGVYRGVVVAMDAPYRGYPKHSYRGQKATDGIRVRFPGKPLSTTGTDWSRVVTEFHPDGDALEDTTDRVVPSRLIFDTWENYERRLSDHKAAAAKAQTELAQRERRRGEERLACDAAAKRLREAGVRSAQAHYLGDYRTGYYRVVIPASDAERFADLLVRGSGR